ncbi:class I SAM-dependent methyltransferase [Parahaliea sp. F7430]|uniref:Class I SAM-dependent methyltransferase n=1 Tax=Sediminihaliea albiluteola TaxID=2758564 RepID=A0A7W2YI02_9GAMM|nr:class I SAM-dependent methyltransferase [Sediminihaliea albiluteola]MBA6411547.1 class I SAM-dependent methyltransferase [Sediminihaliea albiluteola]
MNSNKNKTKKIKEFYDTVYYKTPPKIVTPSYHHRRLTKKLKINKNSNVLDVACGTGAFLAACQEKGARISGVDLSDVAISTCRLALPSGSFHSCAAESLPFKDNHFNLVTCLGSLEHFIDPLAALKEMQRVATEDALFVILVPNKDFLTRKFGLYKGTHQVDAKEDVKSLAEWDALFEESGLEVNELWKDLHVLSWQWISNAGISKTPIRILQALALTVWPMKWQYQVYHSATKK